MSTNRTRSYNENFKSTIIFSRCSVYFFKKLLLTQIRQLKMLLNNTMYTIPQQQSVNSTQPIVFMNATPNQLLTNLL